MSNNLDHEEDDMDVEILPNQILATAEEEHARKLAEFTNRRVARSLVVPTVERDVHAVLRNLGLPICLFGEDLYDKRERLREALVAKELREKKPGFTPRSGTPQEAAAQSDTGPTAKQDSPDEEYYTEGTEDLRELRIDIACKSLARAKKRIEIEKLFCGKTVAKSHVEDSAREEEARTVEFVRGCSLQASQIGDSRPISSLSMSYSPFPGKADEWIVATGSWSGDVKIWGEGINARQLQTIQIHSARISSVVISREYPDLLLTSSADKTATLFRAVDSVAKNTSDSGANLESEVYRHMLTLSEHSQRVTDCKVHPFRKSLIITSSFDGTFVLFDDGRPLLVQTTGHSGVYKASFHCDGGLLATCGLEGGIRLWDLRSGRAVMTMGKAHVGAATCIEFSVDGLLLVSGGGDNQVKVWDLRKKCCSRTIPAHMSLVSSLRFTGAAGDALLTSSFDNTVKAWSVTRNWSLLKAFTGHSDKVTCVDSLMSSTCFATSCYDKTWKIWGNGEFEGRG